VLGVYVL